jgi:hypothetical protein
MSCPHKLLSGPRQGKKCGSKLATGSNYCSLHRYKYEKVKLTKLGKKLLESDSSSSSEEAPKKKQKRIVEMPKPHKKSKKVESSESSESSEEIPKKKVAHKQKKHQQQSEDELSPIELSEEKTSIMEEEDPFESPKKNSTISDQPKQLNKNSKLKVYNEMNLSDSEEDYEEPSIPPPADDPNLLNLVTQLENSLTKKDRFNATKVLNELIVLGEINEKEKEEILSNL